MGMKFGKHGEIDVEAEANYFAMCILMPEDMIRSDIAKSDKEGFDYLDDSFIVDLADRYQVTTQMMIMRLVDLGIMRVV